MTTKIEQEIESLKHLIADQNKARKNSNYWMKYIGPAITILVLGSGLVGSWTSLNAQSVAHQQEIQELKEKDTAKDRRIRDLELKNAGDTQILKEIQKDISEINKKLDKLGTQ